MSKSRAVAFVAQHNDGYLTQPGDTDTMRDLQDRARVIIVDKVSPEHGRHLVVKVHATIELIMHEDGSICCVTGLVYLPGEASVPQVARPSNV